MLVLEDTREYIFPIYSVKSDGINIYIDTRIFLGTGFFVSKKGDALTANHVIPEEVAPDCRLIAILFHNGQQAICWINNVFKFKNADIALIEINIQNNNFLEISAETICSGQDIEIIGIPKHDRNNAGKEMRVLKGHVTLSHTILELNFPVPAGMSGSPVFKGTQVIGIATGRVRSEEIEDSYEEIQMISDHKEVIKLTEIRSVIYYGLSQPFSTFKHLTHEDLNNITLFDFITEQNQ